MDITARDRVHIKFCTDKRCVIESDQPGERCKNLDFLLDRVEREANEEESHGGLRR